MTSPIAQMDDSRIELAVWDKVVPEPNSGCWLFVGAHSKSGYGQARRRGVTYYVHRLMFEAFVGKISEGLEIDHLCRVRCCVNPVHLEPVTHAENMRRSPLGFNDPRISALGVAAFRKKIAAQMHCKHGHLFDRRYGRQRSCSTCQNARYRRRIGQ